MQVVDEFQGYSELKSSLLPWMVCFAATLFFFMSLFRGICLHPSLQISCKIFKYKPIEWPGYQVFTIFPMYCFFLLREWCLIGFRLKILC